MSGDVLSMTKWWSLVDDLMGGTDAMRLAAERRLPRWPNEDSKSYLTRLSVATLFPAFEHTVSALTGGPFGKPVEVDKDAADMEAWLNDIDLEGRNLTTFGKDVCETAIANGMTHILVEYPTTEGADVRTKAQEQALGIRPYMVHIKPNQILGWRTEKLQGDVVLTQVRILECVKEDVGEFQTTDVQQVRVITPTTWQVWREVGKRNSNNWALIRSGVNTLGKVPLVTIYTGRQGFMVAKPPMLNLAHMNVKHWQSSSDQDTILHTARVPILAVSGVENASSLTIGASSAWALPENAKAEYVEHSGAAIDAGQKSLDDLEDQMSAIGAQLITNTPTGEMTATQASIDKMTSLATLGMWTLSVQDGLNTAIDLMSEWTKRAVKPAKCRLNLDFLPSKLDAQEITAQLELWRAGVISLRTLFENLQRGSIVSEEITFEEEQERITQNPVPEPTLSGEGNGNEGGNGPTD